MTFELSQEEGETLVKLARTTIEEYLKNKKHISIPPNISEKLLQQCGVFVTINSVKREEKELRGCIGYPYPTDPLAKAVIESAINAATEDPRFYPLTLKELDTVVLEVSVLTPPQKIEAKTPKEYPFKIKVGEDGLIVEKGLFKGLLLPQVPIEWNWDTEEFLCQCCAKAGISPDSWLLSGTKLSKFQCVIAQETSPNGPVLVINARGEKVA